MDLDWLEASKQEWYATYDELGESVFDELLKLYGTTFRREREALRTGQPKSMQELGPIPWGLTDCPEMFFTDGDDDDDDNDTTAT